MLSHPTPPSCPPTWLGVARLVKLARAGTQLPSALRQAHFWGGGGGGGGGGAPPPPPPRAPPLFGGGGGGGEERKDRREGRDGNIPVGLVCGVT
jgi:hypothetical protein